MAHQEPMDVDSEFDNKENSLHHSNVLPFTEKGYEELDVSELNMKLRYSVTPAGSPMSKSYTACLDNRTIESGDESNITVNENANLTRSLNSTLTKNDSPGKTLRTLPLQTISSEQFDSRNTSVLRQLDSTISGDADVTVTVSGPGDIDENLSLPSTSSSAAHTPEATTPTKEPIKHDGGSPIMRGLKSVLSMFRSSQSPISSAVNEKQDSFSPSDVSRHEIPDHSLLASTPMSTPIKKEPSPSKRNSPKEHRESIVFNEDLETELQWKDETTILFSEERIPIHKLFLPHSLDKVLSTKTIKSEPLNKTIEDMDVSYNDSLQNETLTEYEDVNNTLQHITSLAAESDSEFVDCETTFNKNDDNETPVDQTFDLEITTNVENTNSSGSRLKPIVLNTTQDILDATLSITPEDLLLEAVNNSNECSVKSDEVILQTNATMSIEQNKTADSENTLVMDATNSTIDSENNLILDATETTENITTRKPILDETINTEIKNNLQSVTSISTSNHSLSNSQILENPANDGILDSTHNICNESKNLTVSATSPSEYMDNTQTLDKAQILNNVEILENTKIFDNTQILDNTTDTICTEQSVHQSSAMSEEKLSTPLMDQTAEIVTEVIAQHKTLDSTETTQNVANTTDVIDTFNSTRVLDSTRTIDTSVLDHNVVIPQPNHIENEEPEKQNLEISAVNEVQSTLEKDQQESPENINNLDQTAIIHDKSIEVGVALENNLIPNENSDTNLNKLELMHSSPEVPTPVMSSHEILEAINKPLSSDAIVNLSKEVTSTELPIDIPLPDDDDDDIEKEMHVPAEITSDVITASLPLDLVDTIKSQPETCTNIVSDIEIKENFNSGDKSDIVSDPSPPVVMFEGGDVLNNDINQDTIKCESDHVIMSEKIIENNILPESLVSLPPVNDIVKTDDISDNEEPQIVNKSDVEDKEIEPECVPSVNSTPNENEIRLEPCLVIDSSVNSENQDINKEIDTIILSQQNLETNIQNQENISININESVCMSTPLPDIVNQTIPLPEIQETSKDISCSIEKMNTPAVIMAVPENPIMVENCPQLLTDTLPIDTLKQIDVTSLNSALENTAAGSPNEDVLDVTMADVTMTDLDQPNKTVNENSGCNLPNNQVNQNAIDEMEIDQNLSLPLHDSSVTEPTEHNKIEHNTDIVCNTTNILTENSEATRDLTLPTIELPTNDLHINNLTIDIIENKVTEEEIVASRNNSPFVSVVAEDLPSEDPKIDDNIETTFVTNSRVVITPPASPPIASKGYNFNFDEIVDPFATKTKVRLSPPLDTPNKFTEPKQISKPAEKPKLNNTNNRRKSQPCGKSKFAGNKKTMNSTLPYNSRINGKALEKPEKLEAELNINTSAKISQNPIDVISESKVNAGVTEESNKPIDTEIKIQSMDKIESPPDEPAIENNQASMGSCQDLKDKEIKTPSSSEQSTYYSAGASSSESSHVSKNVFNIPEIDDLNFNPFASKSKMRQSPPPEENPFVTKSKIRSSPDSSMVIPSESNKSEDKMETEAMEKEIAANLSSTTTSSKTTVKTEDEDTIEGPFLEAEDLNDDFVDENIDIMQFNHMPQQSNDLNADEMFIDAEAFEFLLNQNKSNIIADSGKESLFLKFDPLFAKRMSAITSDTLAALNKVQKRQSTPTKSAKSPQKDTPSPIPGPSNLNVTQDIDFNIHDEVNEDLIVTVSKPMMVVPPAVNSVTPRNKSLTPNTSNRSLTPNSPNRSNRRSLTFTSPAMAVIDRLLNLSGNHTADHDTTANRATREQYETDMALTQLRELLAEKEINVYNLRSERRELQDRLSAMESQMKTLESEGQQRLRKINDLNEKLAEKTKINKSMAAVVEEYERTIASLIAETAQDKKRHAEERMKLISERDEQTAHLASMEVSFSDLHSKYEKSKQIIFSCKANEDAYKKSIKEFEENLKKMQNNYELLKQHATSKLNHANTELEKMNKAHESEVLKLNAMIKRKDLHITSLEETLAQKTKANDELTAICDELINKVG